MSARAPEPDPRVIVKNVRMAKSELAHLTARAATYHLPLSTYLRQAGLGLLPTRQPT